MAHVGPNKTTPALNNQDTNETPKTTSRDSILAGGESSSGPNSMVDSSQILDPDNPLPTRVEVESSKRWTFRNTTISPNIPTETNVSKRSSDPLQASRPTTYDTNSSPTYHSRSTSSSDVGSEDGLFEDGLADARKRNKRGIFTRLFGEYKPVLFRIPGVGAVSNLQLLAFLAAMTGITFLLFFYFCVAYLVDRPVHTAPPGDGQGRVRPVRPNPGAAYGGEDFSKHVNVFMGTEAGGNMFPGVTYPFGVVKAGIDMVPPGRKGGDPYSGYLAHGQVTGFSLMHESGTGGAPKYGVVAQMPYVGSNLKNPLQDISVGRATSDTGEVGYYRSDLDNGVVVEITAGRHAGLFRYGFPEGNGDKQVVVDVSHFLPSFRGQGIEQHYLGGEIRVGKTRDRHIYKGYGEYRGGWNLGEPWRIYFCGEFNQRARDAKVFSGTAEKLDYYSNTRSSASSSTEETRVGAVFNFGGNAERVEARIGISFLDAETACYFKDDELNWEWTFDDIKKGVQNAWNLEVFSTITTPDTNSTRLSMLYTALYGMFLIPSDRTGENPLWQSTEPYYDDIFTLWDLFRSHMPLWHILLPTRYTGFVRSLIDTWRYDGYLPEARSSNFNGRVQGGSNADNVLADAYIKGVRHPYLNWTDGFLAMQTNAEVPPINNKDKMSPTDSTKEGRGALPDWLSLGFISTKHTRSVSRAVEYSLNDFALSQVASGLGFTSEHEKYLARAKQWRRHWNPTASAYNFTGFAGPLRSDGSPVPFNPSSCGGCYWSDDWYQVTPFENSFGAIHDVPKMITLMGGDQKFTERLETLFSTDLEGRNGRPLFDVGNEPSFASPYLFNFVGRQDLTVKYARGVVERHYGLGRNGLPGNSDAGAMQSYLLCSMLGFYPIVTTPTFLIGSPWFKEVTVWPDGKYSGSARKVTIKRTVQTEAPISPPGTEFGSRAAEAEGGEKETRDGSKEPVFVQQVLLNGKNHDRNWFNWEELFEKGGELEVVVGEERSNAWETGERPPSGIQEDE